ncbi:tetratricopeptide repeat protein [Phormidium sp. CLA17]|nr:tetratricopeptide repeat protein [Leptolyngbya sp. Cla-17]
MPSALKLWTKTFGNSGLEAPYRYRFERSPESVTTKLGQEVSFYKERIRQDPSSGLNRALLSKTYLRMARATGETSWYLLAEQTAQESLAKLPFNNDGAIFALARVATAKHDFPSALKLIQQASQNEETLALQVTANLAMGNLPSTKQASDRLVAQNPSLNSFTLRALVGVSQGNDQAAMQDFQQALASEEPEETGSSVWARTGLGRLYFKRGKLDQAEKLYQEALRILPNYPPALLNSAELAIRRGQYQTAEKFYSQFFQLSTNSPSVYDHVIYRGMARVKELEGQSADATQWRNEAEARLRKDLTTFGHRRELARLLLERGRPQDLTEALTLMQAEVKVRRDAETMDTLAWSFSQLGRWPEAQTAMQAALRSGIRDPALFYRAGTIEQALGRSSQAAAFFKAAQETDPTFDDQARQALGLGVGLLGLN